MESSVFTQVVMPVCLFIIMFGMGLSLSVSDFSRTVRYPLAVSVGLLGQMVLLPGLGLMISLYLVEDPAVAMGIMLLAACPGGTTSNLVTYLAKGDVALSVSLTAVSSLLTIISIPLILYGSMLVISGSAETIELPVDRIIKILFVITLIPVFLGMLVRKINQNLAGFLEPKINRFSSLFLIFLVFAVVIRQREVIFGAFLEAWYAAFALNIVAMLVAFSMATRLRLKSVQITSLTIEVGIQNSALAILLATTIMNSPSMAVTPAVYTLVMYLGGGLFVLSRRYETKQRSLA